MNAKELLLRVHYPWHFPSRQAFEANMLEQPLNELFQQVGSLTIRFRPFEVKTLRLQTALEGGDLRRDCSNV